MRALLVCKPQPAELERRSAVRNRLGLALAKGDADSEVEIALVGSAASGLAVAGADLDFELSARFVGDASTGVLERLRTTLFVDGGIHRCGIVHTRSAAPDLLQYEDRGVSVDVSLRHGSGGQSAGVAKASFVRSYNRNPLVRSLSLLVKLWAKRRRLVDPTRGRLNSFAWALMAIFYVQVSRPELLLVERGTHDDDAAYWSWVQLHAGAAADGGASADSGGGADSAEIAVASLTRGFFDFWRHFDLGSVASVRHGRALPADETALTAAAACATAARARQQSADGRCFLASRLPSLLLEDPAEPDENVARTLAETFEWKAELARAAHLLGSDADLPARGAASSDEHTGWSRAWSRVCVPPGRGRAELAPYLLASLEGTFPAAVKQHIEAFLAGRAGDKLRLPPMEGGQRLAMHQLASGLGHLTSKSEGSGATRHVVWYRARAKATTGEQMRSEANEAAGEAAGEAVAQLSLHGLDAAEEDVESGDDEELEVCAPGQENPFAALQNDDVEEEDEDEQSEEGPIHAAILLC